MLSITLPTFLTSLYVGINMGARLGGAKTLSLLKDCNRLTSFTSASLKVREDVINIAGWLTRIPWWALLFAWSAINVWQAAQLELINDEAYYWMFSRFPDWGYFDHPPMVAWWINIGAWAGGELGVRLASLICWTLGGWLFVQLSPTSAGHGCGALVHSASLELVQ